MTPLIFSHDACLGHDAGPRHPERPDRLRAVQAALKADEFDDLEWRRAPLAERDQLARVHHPAYLDGVLAAEPREGLVHLDADTVIGPGSCQAALRGAGAMCAAVDAVAGGEASHVFCAVRPPGHHAEPDRAMGFCLFNNVAIGALHARAVHGLGRIAVVDFDVHHGNGTQAAFWNDPELFYASTHQSPWYPGTGAVSETGVAGNILNLPLAAGAGSAEFRDAVESRLLPAVEAFRPELLILSAGFDAHADDPLADLRFSTEDFAWITLHLCEIASKYSGGRIVSSLEGGYHLEALAQSAAAHVRALRVE